MRPLRVLELRFGFEGPPSEFEEAVGSLAGEIAAVPGLVWKIWLMDEGRREAGGVCLFTDRGSAHAFRSSRLLTEIRDHPAVSGFRIREYEVIEDLTRVTRGPVREAGASAPSTRLTAEVRFVDRRAGVDRRGGRERRSGRDRRSGRERRIGSGMIVYPDRRSGGPRRSDEERRSGAERRSGEERRELAW